jgi:hypothetical protein
MPFDQSTITEVRPPAWDGSTLHIEWSSTSPPGTTFQVYVGRVLAWYGTSRWVAITMPPSRVRIDVGAVAPGEAARDFSALLPPAPSDRVELDWLGGTFLDPTGGDDVQGFRVYGSPLPGAGVDYSSPLAEIQAYPSGVITDGYGLGGFGQGGFGRAASSYRWTSPSLARGRWTFAVAPFDAAGNEAAPSTKSALIQSPPGAPGAGPDGSRLSLSYDPATRRATLAWRPGAA